MMNYSILCKQLLVAVIAGTVLFSAVLTGCSEDEKKESESKTSVSNNAESKTFDKTKTADKSSTQEYKAPENSLSSIVNSGICGENVTWEFDENGLLIISGSGRMNDYGSYDVKPPWFDYKNTIKTVIVKNDVTSFGDWAFRGYKMLTSVTISDDMTSIGNEVFNGCKSLTQITIPDSMTSIGTGAFAGCRSLTGLTIPDSVTSIGDDAFVGSTNLTIYGKAGSYAETYAKKNGIPFISD